MIRQRRLCVLDHPCSMITPSLKNSFSRSCSVNLKSELWLFCRVYNQCCSQFYRMKTWKFLKKNIKNLNISDSKGNHIICFYLLAELRSQSRSRPFWLEPEPEPFYFEGRSRSRSRFGSSSIIKEDK